MTPNWNSTILLGEAFATVTTYDALNRPVTVKHPDNTIVSYGYDKGGLLKQIVQGSTQYITNITYNARGQREQIYYGNGTKTLYEYYAGDYRLAHLLTTCDNGQKVLQDLTYSYDVIGNIIRIEDDAQQTSYFSNQVIAPVSTFEYDALHRLVKATGRELIGLTAPSNADFVNNKGCPNTASNAMRNYTHNYAYDQMGNILSDGWKSYVYDTSTNRLLRHTGTTNAYTYDAHGNMTKMPNLTAMNWDCFDRLISAANGSTFTSYYAYDAEGNRTRKVTVKGTVREERYYIGAYEVYRKYTGSTLNTERKSVNVADDEKVFVRKDGTLLRYQYDNHLGSACLELDHTGAIISYEEYHPFGTTSYRSGRSETEVSLKRYKYCGKERDEETGLYYYGARYYAAWLCRFVSCDPLQHRQPDKTPYHYCSNNPINKIDPTGMTEEDPPKRNQYINPKGEIIGSAPSDVGDIFVVHDTNVLETLSNGESFDFSSLTEDQAFKLPSFEMRQEIQNAIENADYSKDSRGNLIADFEIGGYLQYYEEYAADDKFNKIGSGLINRMRPDGNRVTNNTDQASISLEIDTNRDPLLSQNNGNRDMVRVGSAEYSWHTHLNVFFDEVGRKLSYQEMNLNSLTNNTKTVGKNFFSGERGSNPSEADIKNIGVQAKTGIVVDMVGGVHLYNKNVSVKIPQSIFFSFR